MEQNKRGLENSIEQQCNINKQLEEVCKMESQKLDHVAGNNLISEFRADFMSFSSASFAENEESHENVLPPVNIIDENFIRFMRRQNIDDRNNFAG